MRTWKFTHEGVTYREGDVTLDQWDKLEAELEKPWHKINPILSAKDARVVLRTLIAARTGDDIDSVDKVVGALTTDDFLKMLSEAENDLPEEYENGVPQ